MPGQKAYPRATVKKIVKAHANCNVSKNVDVMVSKNKCHYSQNPTRRTDIAFVIDLSRLCFIHANVGSTFLHLLRRFYANTLTAS